MVEVRNANSRKEVPGQEARITSRDNRWSKRFRTALSGEHLEDGFVGVEGVRLVEAALGSGLPIQAVLASDSGGRHLLKIVTILTPGVQVLRTTDRIFAGIADTQAPQGIAALIRPTHATLEGLLAGIPLLIVLVGVQDPGNVGTILRAAEAFGATGAIASSIGPLNTADPLGPKALRASAGSALRLPVLRGMSPAVLLPRLEDSGVKLYAAVVESNTSPRKARDAAPTALRPWEVDWKTPCALLIGNEGAGLPEEIVQSAHARVSIPQVSATGRVGIESLNAAMAATVLLYEAMRQRT